MKLRIIIATLLILQTILPNIALTQTNGASENEKTEIEQRDTADEKNNAESKAEREKTTDTETQKNEGEEELQTEQTSLAAAQAAEDSSLYKESAHPTKENLNIHTNEQTGALTFSYPITLPKGRNDFTPELSLTYNSQNKANDSMLGYGFDLSIPTIKRTHKKGTDRLYAEPFFESTLAGGELTPISINNNSFVGTYGARIEYGDFLTHTFTADNTWIVSDKSGTTYTFGSDAESQIVDPDDANNIHTWMVQKIQDVHNNTIEYTYQTYGNKAYPLAIYYGDIYSVHFTLEDRTDPLRSYITAFFVQNTKRISQIEVRANGQWTRQYDITYTTGDNGHRSLVHTVVERGRADDGTIVEKNPLTFGYSQGIGGWQQTQDGISAPFPHFLISGNQDNGVRILDFNRDAYPDFLYRNNQDATQPTESGLYLRDPMSETWESAPFSAPSALVFNHNGQPQDIRLVDRKGDYHVDFVRYKKGSGSANFPSNEDGTGWGYSALGNPPLFLSGQSGLSYGGRIFDVNADGNPDFLESHTWGGITSEILLDTAAGWNHSYVTPVPFANASDDNGTAIADINGDGLNDIIRSMYIGGWPATFDETFYNNGNTWLPDTGSPGVPTLIYSETQNVLKGVRVADVNGDGLDDILEGNYQSNGGSTQSVYLNKGNDTGWNTQSAFPLPAHFSQSNQDRGGRLIDYNADGLLDMIVNCNCLTAGGIQKRWLNLGPVPDMLTHISFPSGAASEFFYTPSSHYRTDTELSNKNLPYILQTVSLIQTDDGLGNTSKVAYHYSDGNHYQTYPLDRRFAGFGHVVSVNDQGHATEYFFHQGNEADVQAGEHVDSRARMDLVYRKDIRQLPVDTVLTTYLDTTLAGADGTDVHPDLATLALEDAPLMLRERTHWETTELSVDPESANVASFDRTFVKPHTTLMQHVDGNNDHRDTAISRIFDNGNGNLLEEKNYGEVSVTQLTDSIAAPETFDMLDDKTVTTYAYATNPEQTILAQSQILTIDTDGAIVAERRYLYDELPFGQLIVGNNTKERARIAENVYADTDRTFNELGMMTSETDPNGNTTSYTFGPHMLYPQTITNAKNQETSYTYNYANGEPKTITDPNGFITQTTFDGFDRPTILAQSNDEDPTLLETLQAFVYNDTGFPTSVENQTTIDDGLVFSTYEYRDGFDRPVLVISDDDQPGQYRSVLTRYDSLGKRSLVTLPFSSNNTLFDASPSYNPALETAYTFDALGRMHTQTNTLGQTTHDFDQWTEKIVDPMGNTKKYISDARGRLIMVEEKNGEETYTTTYAYDWLGNLTQIEDAIGQVRNFTYDTLGRRLSAERLHDPSDTETGTWTFTYDAVGNKLSRIDARNVETIYTYDELNRPLSETSPNAGDAGYTYTYDLCPYGIGRLCSTNDASDFFERTFAYTPRGNIASETTRIGDSSATPQTTNVTYTQTNQVATRQYPDGTTVFYTFHKTGELDSTTYQNQSEETEPLVLSTEYSLHGSIATRTFSNGATETYTYDETELYRLKNKQTVLNVGEETSQTLQDLTYTYNAVGNILSLVDSSQTKELAQTVVTTPEPVTEPKGDVDGSGDVQVGDVQCTILTSQWALGGQTGPAPACLLDENPIHADIDCNGVVNVTDVLLTITLSLGTPLNPTIDADQDDIVDSCENPNPIESAESVFVNTEHTSVFIYDDLYRLIEAVIQDETGETDIRSYTYDAVGNMLSKSDQEAYTYTAEKLTNVGDAALQYDENGNVTHDGTWSHTYDHNNRLAASTHENETIVYGYDQEGTRVHKTNLLTGNTSQYVSDHYVVENEKTRKRIPVEHAIVATIEQSVDDGESVVSHHTDHLNGNTLDIDQAGTVYHVAAYYPFGEERISAQGTGYQNPYSFSGKELDAGTGLQYFGARYYAPHLGRFTQVDPASFLQPEAFLKNPQELNPYSYVANNPLIFVDENGEFRSLNNTLFGPTYSPHTRAVQQTLYQGLETMADAAKATVIGGAVLSAQALTAYFAPSTIPSIVGGNVNMGLRLHDDLQDGSIDDGIGKYMWSYGFGAVEGQLSKNAGPIRAGITNAIVSETESQLIDKKSDPAGAAANGMGSAFSRAITDVLRTPQKGFGDILRETGSAFAEYAGAVWAKKIFDKTNE